MKYDAFYIMTEPDYAESIDKGETVEEVSCWVYDADDVSEDRCLGEFNMMIGFEFQESTVESIEAGIRNCVDNDYSFFVLSRKEKEFERTNELFHRAIHLLRITFGEKGFEKLLQKELDMTKEEVKAALAPPEEEQTEELKLC